MMPNGFVGSWMLIKRDKKKQRIILTGLSEKATEEVGELLAKEARQEFVRVASWRHVPW
jgi:hypothetical protein